MNYKIPLILAPQPEGGYTVTSPLLPELVTEGDTVEEALDNVKDALAAVVETYQELGRSLPKNAMVLDDSVPVCLETVVTAP
ncbi:MAG: type II toxin-antitoxin system HicB family antitoxin [Planctomycetes bacterium]|nr:type II toxin-antitoxin system HicB family antitoxin [Planctomycetota bacterium]